MIEAPQVQPLNPEVSSMNRLAFIFLISFFAVSASPLMAETPVASAPVVLGDEEIVSNPNSITLDFKEADINTVLRVLSLKSKVNIVAGPEVQGNVTIRLESVPWEKALEVVLRTYGYVYERDENIIRVTTRENLAAEPLVTQTFILNYTKAAEVQFAVQDILTERGRIKIAERTNTLIITDVPTNLYTISEVLKKLDRPTPAAYIDSKIVATTVGVAENMGIEWQTGGPGNLGSLNGSSRPTTFPFKTNEQSIERISPLISQFFPLSTATSSTPTGGTFSGAAGESASGTNLGSTRFFPINATPTGQTYTFGTLSFSGFSAVLQMLRSRTNTRVVSNPRIVVLNNQTASIHVGDNIPLPTFDTNSTTGRLVVSGFNYDKLKTGVTMDVVPHINANDEILVELKPSVNTRGDNISFNQDLSAPIISETTAQTQVLIQSGQTIAIGGLMTDNVQMSEAKVPYLSEIPILGKAFRSKRQTAGSSNQKVETLFFVTVSIVDSEGQPVIARNDKLKAAKAAASALQSAPSGQTVVSKDQPANAVETQALDSNAVVPVIEESPAATVAA